MNLLKQSTATTLKLGPFVDDVDFKTAETSLTIAQGDIQISKGGGAFAQTSEASPVTTHDADGWYPIPLTATDTGTLGRLTVQVAVSGALPVWWEGMVVPANIYDSLVSGSDNLQVDTVQVEGGDATDALGVAQTGDSYALIGAAGVGLTALGDARLANLDAAVSSRSSHAEPDLSNLDVAVSSRLAAASYVAPDDAATIAAEVAALDAIRLVQAFVGGKFVIDTVARTITFYDTDGVTPLFTHSLSADYKTRTVA